MTYHVRNEYDHPKKSIFDRQVQNKALVNSGCVDLVAGYPWMQTYESTKNEVFPVSNCGDKFKLGETVYTAHESKTIPIKIGTMEEEIKVAVISADIPLLISRQKLKEWGCSIDFLKNTLFLGKTKETIPIEITSSGHMVIPITKNIENNKNEVVNEVLMIKKNDISIDKIKKIHRMFGHPSAEKLKLTLKDSGVKESKLMNAIDKVNKSCRICRKFKRKESRPRICMPRARHLNEVVSLDLKPVSTLINKPEDKRHVLYVLDEFSRFISGSIMKNKEADTVAKTLLDSWCLGGLGYPSKCFHVDNGKEFQKNTLEAITKKTGTKVQVTQHGVMG